MKQDQTKTKCRHRHAFFFHENAPMYCPKCGNYIDGGKIVGVTDKNNQDSPIQPTE